MIILMIIQTLTTSMFTYWYVLESNPLFLGFAVFCGFSFFVTIALFIAGVVIENTLAIIQSINHE